MSDETSIVPEYVDDEDPTFRAIENTGTLDWAMSRLAAIKGEVAEIERQKEATISKVEQRAATLTGRLSHGVSYFESMIEEYASRERRTLLGGGKKKSRSLLHGTVGWRSKPGRLKVTDAPDAKERLRAWLESLPVTCGLYSVEVKPDLDAIARWYAEPLAEGEVREVPPGMEWSEGTDVFYVKPELPEGPALSRKP